MKRGDVLHRLKIAEGHLKKVIKMVEDKEYCIDILNQSLAVQKALRKVDELILENHLKTCVKDAFEKGNSKKSISEIIKVLGKK
jgi:DNA-binding FrmR family transcriptional regulator